MTDRDELARLIFEVPSEDPACVPSPRALADAILAAGYRKHRIITTAEELDALPVGSVVDDAYAAICTLLDADPSPYSWMRVTTSVRGHSHRHRPYLPATVLYVPEEQS